MPKTVTKASTSSRGSYQKGYALGNKGGSSPKAAGGSSYVKGEQLPSVSSGRTGGRPKKLGSDKGDGDINISYGRTVPITDLQTVADFGKDVKAGKALGAAKAVDYAKKKGDEGSGFNYRKRR